MPDKKTDTILIRFPVDVADRLRAKVALSPHYGRKLCVFVTAAVREKLARESPPGGKIETTDSIEKDNSQAEQNTPEKV